jgi:hypothetical protein
MAHESDSLEHRNAEPVILAGVSAVLGVELAAQTLQLEHGARVDVDGVAPDQSVLVEIYAHQGRLKGGQVHKVARDALKLITIARGLPVAPKLVIAFGDADAAACVTARSWLSEALRSWSIEVLVVELRDDLRAGLRAAQVRQVMVNPPPPAAG